MIGMRMEEFKRAFFDPKAVMDAVAKAEYTTLSKYGAFVRTTARQSIRRSKKSSAPGQPPRAHFRGEPSLKTIFFAFDAERRSVVVGPIRFNKHHYQNGILTHGIVPEILEKGGTIGIREKLIGGQKWRKWVRYGRRRPRLDEPVRVRNVTIAARPFMQPAEKENRPEFADLWRDAVLAN